MAKARQVSEWSRVATLVCWVGPAVWGKEPINPLKVIPAPYRPQQEEGAAEVSPEERAAQSKRAWRLLDSFFGKKPQR